MFKKVILLFIIFLSTNISAQIERVEPAFWWVGMKNTQLQLLIHGTEICNRKVEIQYPGIKVLKVNRACSPNYLFVTLDLDPKITKAGKFDIQLSQPEEPTITVNYELKNRRKDSDKRQGFSSADVIYLLMPDRFANGDSTNDNVESQPEKVDRKNSSGRHGGDLKGMQEHLNYIKELGATAIWSTPLLENNYTKYTYHGYAISDYYKIDPRFGSNDDYLKFVAASHQKGLKVIMDMVSNHCGIWAWWMSDLPFEDWIHQFPEYTQTNHKANTIKDIHASKIDKDLFLNGWFDKSMPDMNQQNQYFWTYFIQNSIWWIENADLDGIRMDTYPYNDRDAMAQWVKAITDEYPNFNIMGETWLFSPQDIAFWQKDAVNALHYNSNLPTVMDFILQKALTSCFNEHGKPWEDLGMNRLYNTISNDYLYANINNLLIFAENHDTQRYNFLLNGDMAKFKMAMSFLMTTRGIPQIYYGSEIGMTGNKDKGDGDIRRDFPGGWPGDSINAFSAKGRSSIQNERFDFLSKLLNWRKGKSVIHTGLLTQYVPENDVYVYFRYNETEKIMVILNNNETDQTIKTDRYTENLENITNGTDVMTGKTFDLKSSFTIQKQTALILELH
ncbi:MAG: glycoside hydrolase family 13 protein [Paludibacter sp.]|nr:glycoside hydrolase family 13 protein [Paludibacter sp.]